jgi:hypothetical protein
MTHPDLDPLALASVLDARLHATLDQPFHLARARLYGFTVHDARALTEPGRVDEAVRTTFVGEHPDPYGLVTGSLGWFVTSFDAAGLVTSGWAAPLEPERDDSGRLVTGVRPSRHPERTRVRIVAVVCDAGIATVLRRADDPDTPVAIGERGEGELVDALERLWFGDPLELALERVPARADRSRRARHRR